LPCSDGLWKSDDAGGNALNGYGGCGRDEEGGGGIGSIIDHADDEPPSPAGGLAAPDFDDDFRFRVWIPSFFIVSGRLTFNHRHNIKYSLDT